MSRWAGFPTESESLNAPLTFEDVRWFAEMLKPFDAEFEGVLFTTVGFTDGKGLVWRTPDGALVGAFDERAVRWLLKDAPHEAPRTVSRATTQGFLVILREGKELKKANQKKLKNPRLRG